jgi:hypothetical protein
MYSHFRRAVAADREKLGIALQTAWKADPQPDEILGRLVPDDMRANLDCLAFFLERDAVDQADATWRRIVKNETPSGLNFAPYMAFGYIDRLLSHGRVAEATRVWPEALAKSGHSPADTDSRNAVWNGSFEQPILGGGFDWRLQSLPTARIEVTSHQPANGRRCLAVHFAGENIAFSHLSQIVPLGEPRDYQLEFHVRTSGLTSDQKPYISINSYPDPACVSLRSEPFAPDSPWRTIPIRFTVAGDCAAVRISLQRDVSSKFDNRLKGTVWLDAFSVQPSSGPGAHPRKDPNR